MMKKLMTLVLSIAPVCAVPYAQDAVESPIPLLGLDELTFSSYAPQKVHPNELHKMAGRMVGRQFYVKERGGIGYSEPVQNLSLMGDQIILYDEADYVKRLKDTLLMLDKDANKRPSNVESYRIEQFVPRNISLDSAGMALQPLARNLRDGSYNISTIPERRTVVLRDTQERLDEMLALLHGIDVPEDQVLFTCYLLRGDRETPDSAEAPEELISNLKQLIPGLNFRSMGFAMLQSGLNPDRDIQLGVDGKDGVDFQLSFRPVAYDASTGTVTARRCTVEMMDRTEAGGPKSVFSTDTVFRGGEYTVLGATGQSTTPIFFVVHAKPVR